MALCLNERGTNEGLQLKLAAQPLGQNELVDEMYFNTKLISKMGNLAILPPLFN